MIRVQYSQDYLSGLKELISQNPDISEEINKRIRWFVKKPSDERLKNHALTGKMFGICAFSLDNDLRIIYIWLDNDRVRFIAVGNHEKVYGS
ncbi:type II toxin-antitoxin system mRNA interferase toxin, RelE/StbE family [Candidatus Gottesmanbacteria bacterium]|nr:type II toxin-antitoxin system mRNA interferase toxin, RelE/StbE family [Candidatus Gottesmanbacteria bacterium]